MAAACCNPLYDDEHKNSVQTPYNTGCVILNLCFCFMNLPPIIHIAIATANAVKLDRNVFNNIKRTINAKSQILCNDSQCMTDL
jgi:hypothetical protein